MYIKDFETEIIKELRSYSNNIHDVVIGDDKCKVSNYAIGVTYSNQGEPNYVDSRFAAPYYRFEYGETKYITVLVTKNSDMVINKAYYAIFNQDGEIQLHDEAIIEDDKVTFLYNASICGSYKMKVYMSVGDQIEIAIDDLEVV